jgi:hypothetical protein
VSRPGKSDVGAAAGWRRAGWAVVLFVAIAGSLAGLLAGGQGPDLSEQTVVVTPADAGQCSRTYPPNTGVPGVLALGDSYSAGEGLGGTQSNCYEPGPLRRHNQTVRRIGSISLTNPEAMRCLKRYVAREVFYYLVPLQAA